MKIRKVLNTNAVLATNDAGVDILILGNGIGYKKRMGENVEKERIEREFRISEKAHLNRFIELLSAIPERYFIVSEEIIDFARSEYPQVRLNETISLSLVDHIYNAIDNYLQGVVIPNTMLSDIRRLYPNEYSIGQFGLEIIRENFGQRLPDDEAGFIAMHFIMAMQNNDSAGITKMLSIVREIDELVRQHLGIQFDENSMPFFRYMTHLKFFAERVMKQYHYPQGKGTETLLSITTAFPKEYQCSKIICDYVEQKYKYHPGVEEEIYLMVHLARLGNNSANDTGPD